MKNKFIIFYTIFASAVFAFSVAFFAVNIYKEYSQGQARANQIYNNLVNDLKTYTSIDNQFTQNSAENIKNMFGNFNNFAFVQLYINNIEVLKYPKDANAELTVSNLTKSYNATFSTQNSQIKIICNIYLLRPTSIYYYAKISFLIILIVTIITVILIFYVNSKEKQIATNDDEKHEDDVILSDENALETTEETPIFSENSTFNSSEDEENQVHNIKSQDENKQTENSSDFFDNNENSLNNEENCTEKEISALDSKETIVEQQDNLKNKEEISENQNTHAELPNFETPVKTEQNDENNPKGLFNPVTGFGWESYLQTRLENEISRAISSEIDLAIFLIQLPQIQRKSQEMKNISEYLTLQFQFKDLLFEYKEDSVVAIKISMNLDEALNFADKIYSEITKITDNKDCFIGISTRNIRMVSVERLINEAQAALEHAKEDSNSPIIAFRVDAGKYREYMEQN